MSYLTRSPASRRELATQDNYNYQDQGARAMRRLALALFPDPDQVWTEPCTELQSNEDDKISATLAKAMRVYFPEPRPRGTAAMPTAAMPTGDSTGDQSAMRARTAHDGLKGEVLSRHRHAARQDQQCDAAGDTAGKARSRRRGQP